MLIAIPRYFATAMSVKHTKQRVFGFGVKVKAGDVSIFLKR
jgi:hypothetical protein